jgi:hypothetical protein
MKLQRVFALFFIMLLAAAAVSCDDDDDDVEPSRMELLTAGTWTGAAIFVGGSDFTEFFKNLEDEPWDITTWRLNFNRNGTYTIQGDWLEPSPYGGTWEFLNNEQAILFNKGVLDANGELTEEIATIRRLSSSELYLDMDVGDEDGSTMEGEIRFRR